MACGDMIKLRVFPDRDAVSRSLAESIRTLAMEAADHPPTGIIIAGGRTPLAAYRLLAAQPAEAPSRLHVFFSDDRYVPLDDDNSNAGTITPFLRTFGVPEKQIHCIEPERPMDEAAMRYGECYRSFLDGGGSIRLCFLGMGADGHTAGLFTGDQADPKHAEAALGIQRPDGMAGISLTTPMLRRADRIVLVVTGADKQDMTGNLLRNPQSIPAGIAVVGHSRVELWTDREAQPPLKTL